MTTALAFKVWVMAILCLLAPPGRARSWDHSEETATEGYARYWALASDYEEVLSSLPASDLAFGSKKRTAAYLLAIGWYESGFSRNADLGIGARSRGDGGRSVCHLQTNLGRGRTPEGWSASDLLADRKKCIRRGLTILKASLGACSASPVSDRLAVYASGDCKRGLLESRVRVYLAERIAGRRLPKADAPETVTETPVASAEVVK